MAIDPVDLAGRLTQPLLVIGGGSDLQVGRSDFERLGAVEPKPVTIWIEDMNHVLKRSTGDLAAQWPSYRDPALPIHPQLVRAIADFLKPAGDCASD